jgi:hypothetical protein
MVEQTKHEVFSEFREPRPFPDFYPTYKKYQNREQLDYTNDKWVKMCYRTQ